jgi:hypothetical protein
MLIVACSDVASFKQRLDQIAQLQTQLKTPSGLADARVQYVASKESFRAAYQAAVGKDFTGWPLDYWTQWGGTLDWVPYVELFGTDNCPTGGLPVETVVEKLFPAKRAVSAAALGNSTIRQGGQNFEACACPSPRAECSLGNDKSASLPLCYGGALCALSALGGPVIDSCQCSGASCPQIAGACTSRGLSPDVQSCSIVRANCQGPSVLFEELFGPNGLHCCGCIQRSADTLPSGTTTCPKGWDKGDTACNKLAAYCGPNNGLFQETFTPQRCCRCQLQPQADSIKASPAGFFDFLQPLFDLFSGGCSAALDPINVPIVSGLVTLADVANAAGPRVVWGVAFAAARSLCRASEARAVMFVDEACTDSYESDAGAFDVQCYAKPSVGVEYPWIRAAAGCSATPFYVKNGQDCSGPYKWTKKPAGC